MKISSIILASVVRAKNFIQKEDATQFLERHSRANTGLLTEEFRTGNLERECVEEACNLDEAMEIFEDEAQAKEFINKNSQMCQNLNPCYKEGTKSCVNKWANYWCECAQNWYGKDCDHIDVHGHYQCQNPAGCIHAMAAPPAVANIIEKTTTEAPLAPFESQVVCDAVNDKFIAQLPVDTRAELKMGMDFRTATCGPTNSNLQGSTFEYSFGDCGTRLTIEEDRFIYDNHIGRGPILINNVLRDFGITYNVRCIVDRTGHVDNYDAFQHSDGSPLNGTGEIFPVFGITDNLVKEFEIENSSEFIFRLNVYHNQQFQTKFSIPSFPLIRKFQEEIYLGVETITSIDYKYIFTERCWATPSLNPGSVAANYYPIIEDGCPSDQYTSLHSRINLEDRFSTKAFKFPNSDFVYIQCDVIVCDLRIPDDPECQSTCRESSGPSETSVERSRRSAENSKPREIVTVGPFEVRHKRSSSSSETSNANGGGGWAVAGCIFLGLIGYVGFSKRKEISSRVQPEPEPVVL